MKDRDLLSIGEMSLITGAHVKSLRYYDRIGALSPAYVDESSGYRYYSFDQLQRILAIRACLASEINLRNIGRYVDEDYIDYLRLVGDGIDSIDNMIDRLQESRRILEFLYKEVDFNDRLRNVAPGPYDFTFGTMPLWILPFDEDPAGFDKNAEFLRLAKSAEEHGYHTDPLWFGMLMLIDGTTTEEKLYSMAALRENLKPTEADAANIFFSPECGYRCIERPDLDATAARDLFPELFAQNYDKVVISTITLCSDNTSPAYAMYINLP